MANSSTFSTLKSVEDAYLKGNYDKAADELILQKTEIDTSLFHYNLGSIYLKKGDLGAARYNIEKAIQNGFVGTLPYNNLKVIQKSSEVMDLSKSEYLYEKSLSKALNIPSEAFLSLTLVLILAWILMLKKKLLTHWLPASLFFLFGLTPILFSAFYLDTFSQAIVLKPTLIYEGPSKVYSENYDLGAGSKVLINKENDGWVLIKYPRDIAGWVESKDLGFF